jgi:hypothetical protein
MNIRSELVSAYADRSIVLVSWTIDVAGGGSGRAIAGRRVKKAVNA